jgi:hypothetical protein
MKLSTRATVIAGVLLLGLTACVPTTLTPTPTTTSSSTPTPTPTSTASPSDPEDAEVTAAVVVMTASTLSVFGTDGSTLASVNYELDGAAAAAQIAEALDAEPVETIIPEIGGGPCPEARSYDFGGLVLRSPGSLWAQSSIEVIVTTATTAGGVEIETVAGQQIGATQSAFQAAVGDFMVLYETATVLGFDIVNPEADPYSRVGAYAEFAGGELDYLAAPNILGFIGSCA